MSGINALKFLSELWYFLNDSLQESTSKENASFKITSYQALYVQVYSVHLEGITEWSKWREMTSY